MLTRTLLTLISLAMAFLVVARAEAGEARKPAILVLHASVYASDVQSKLSGSGVFASVTLFDGRAGTPSLATLKLYDAVMVCTDANLTDPVGVGNNLADYVDAGGGVVCTTFATTNFSGSIAPTGRWLSGYQIMGTASSTATAQTLDTTSIGQPNHPILIGVGSFSGGTSSYRANQSSVLAGSTVIARWTGGNVLVATGAQPGRADLNFYPPSKDVRSDFWVTSTDGLKLMVNAMLYVMRPRALVLGSPLGGTWNADVQTKIRATGKLGLVDIMDAHTTTPTLAQLKSYDAVLVYGDGSFQNPVALGNALADYVDAGGGVVQSVFSIGGGAAPTGRWDASYRLLAPTTIATGTAGLGGLAYPQHPVVAGVSLFSGGSASYRPGGTGLNAGAFVVANWSDGRILIAASTKLPNRADLGFYPPSSDVRGDFWSSATGGGGLLMANALLYVCKPYIAVAAADTVAVVNDTVAKLSATRRFSGVGQLFANSGVPPAATLKPFNAMATWSDIPYASPAELGDTLADYVDAGGGVVTGLFGNTNFSSPQGRWVSGGYEIVPAPLPGFSLSGGPVFMGAIVEPLHPVARFVRKFDGGTMSARFTTVPALRGRTIVQWSDGKMLASVHNFRKRADLGFFPASSGGVASGWNQRTDGTWLMANALEYVVRSKPCPGDFNGDGMVDDADFVLFIGMYNTLLDPRGDLNGDGVTDDADFVVFLSSYNALVCP